MHQITLSVIIVSYNNEKVIKDCLNSIKKYNDIGSQLEVIVVEQSPKDYIYNSLKDDFDWVKVIRNRNIGFGGGNNVGVENSYGKYLLFLNPDTILVEPVFSFLIQKFDDDNNLGLAGVRLIDSDGNNNLSYYWNDYLSFLLSGLFKIYNKKNIFIQDKMYIMGADMFVRKSVFEEVGQFDENIFMYCEEKDLCSRIRRAGYSVCFFKDKRIIHLEGKSQPANYVKISLAVIKSDLYVTKKLGENPKKEIRKGIRGCKLRRLMYKVTGNNKAAKLETEVIREYRKL